MKNNNEWLTPEQGSPTPNVPLEFKIVTDLEKKKAYLEKIPSYGLLKLQNEQEQTEVIMPGAFQWRSTGPFWWSEVQWNPAFQKITHWRYFYT